MYQIKNTDIVTICGMRGSGKSEFAKRYLSDLTIPFIIYDPNGEYQEQFPDNTYVPQTESVDEFEIFCKAIWMRGNLIMVVDEAEGVLRERRPLSPYASYIVRRGRHRGIGMIVLTRRIAELNKTVISLSNFVVLYKFFLPNDLKYIAEFISPINAEKLPRLPQYHFIVYNNGISQTFKPIKMI